MRVLTLMAGVDWHFGLSQMKDAHCTRCLRGGSEAEVCGSRWTSNNLHSPNLMLNKVWEIYITQFVFQYSHHCCV